MTSSLEIASARWDSSSAVRSSPNTYDLNASDNSQTSKSWHVKGYSGILSLPEFSHLSDDDIDYVMGMQLLEFVTKQARFEIECVNKVCQAISLDTFPFSVPSKFKLDALKIYTDEGYHSFFTKKLADQILSHLNVTETDIKSVVDQHFEKIYSIGSSFDSSFSYLADLAVVFVAENQIVADISCEMSKLVHQPIVDMFKNHMLDETFHAKYFASLLPVLYDQMDEDQRFIFGANLCESMLILGVPRTDIYYIALQKFGFTQDAISSLIDQKYNNYEWNVVRLRDRMQPTLKLLESIGLFDHISVSSIFKKKGLL